MKKIKKICTNKKVYLGTCLLSGVAVLAYGWCLAMRPCVGVIDFGVAQTKAKLYQSVIAEQRKYEGQIQVRIAADSVDIEKEAKKLESERGNMKPDEYQKKAMALQRRFAVIQDKYRPMVERIVAASQIALKGAEKEISTAIKQTMKQKGVKVLLPRNVALDVAQSADMTDTFVKNLDKLVQSVPYPDPAKLGG